jgi:hypothetical protein
MRGARELDIENKGMRFRDHLLLFNMPYNLSPSSLIDIHVYRTLRSTHD